MVCKRKGASSNKALASENLKRKKLDDILLMHTLLSSNDPEKHKLVVSMIEKGADVNGCNAKGKSLMCAAVECEAFGVVQAILKKTPNNCDLLEVRGDAMALIFRSSHVAKLLTLSSQHCVVDFAKCDKFLPWGMSNDHLVTVLKTLLQLAHEKGKSDVEEILRCVVSRNYELAKVLIKCRTEANERLINLQTLLSYEFILENLEMVTFIIGEGADINGTVNEEKEYPLHLACRQFSKKTMRLFLELGADVSVTDRSGNTILSTHFNLTRPNDYYNTESDAMYIAKYIVKHIALQSSAAIRQVNDKDLSTIKSQSHLQKYYESCVEELKRMKTVKAADGFSYSCFFSKPIYQLSLLMRNPEIYKQLRHSVLPVEPEVFPIFKSDMMMKFGIARKMRIMMDSRESDIVEVFSENLPCVVLRKINISSFDLKYVEKELKSTRFLAFEDNIFRTFINQLFFLR